MRTALTIAAIVPLLAVSVLAADLPYTGNWKLNPAKSDFGATTITYEKAGDGGIKVTVDGVSYTFKTDGREYPTPWGMTVESKSVDERTWQTTNRANGKVTGTDTMTLSADGKTLTVESENMKATGEASHDTLVLQRVSGGPGLMGKWKTANMKMSAPGVLELAKKGADGLTLTFVDLKGVCDGKLDGKDYPAAGPMWPSGWTCSLAKNGDRAFNLKWNKDGKPMYQSTFTLSTDGATLTEVGGAVATSEKNKSVYDRQ